MHLLCDMASVMASRCSSPPKVLSRIILSARRLRLEITSVDDAACISHWLIGELLISSGYSM